MEGREVDAQKILTTDVLMTNDPSHLYDHLNYVKACHHIMEVLTIGLRDMKELDAQTSTKLTVI